MHLALCSVRLLAFTFVCAQPRLLTIREQIARRNSDRAAPVRKQLAISYCKRSIKQVEIYLSVYLLENPDFYEFFSTPLQTGIYRSIISTFAILSINS